MVPYRKRQDRRVLSRTPKFFLFDVGVAGALVKRRIAEPRREQFGHALEHVGGIRNVPWEGFLSRLWAGEIIA